MLRLLKSDAQIKAPLTSTKRRAAISLTLVGLGDPSPARKEILPQATHHVVAGQQLL